MSIISAFKDYNTDQNFFQIIYGESILNDAISIVSYETCAYYEQSNGFMQNIWSALLYFIVVMLGSTLIGFFTGFITAIILKIVSSKVKRIERIEIGLMVIIPWVSYLIAQVI